MDIEHPYADGPSRRHLLYRLRTAPPPRRLLLVSGDPESDLIGTGWGSPVTVLAPSGLDASFLQSGTRFDAVALPWVTGLPSSTGCDGQRLLKAAHTLLVPGGVVMGHLRNIQTLRRLGTARGLAEVVATLTHRGAMGSAAGCAAVLLRAGYAEPECWYVQPSISSPMGLIPSDPTAARAYFLRSIRSAQGHYSRSAYLARLLVAALGLGGMQQAELFFWAKKPC